MSVTVHTFPPVQGMDSSRGWVLAIIALIHLGFFWALTSGLARSVVSVVLPRTTAVVIEPEHRPPPEPRKVTEPQIASRTFIPFVPLPPIVDETPADTAPRNVTHDPQPLVPITTQPERAAPVEVGPQIDPRRGLTEPLYPPALIRQNAEGTVLLSVQVLENGRVGDVRIERSSGHARLDESAAREAKRWRLIPGTRDGVPVVLWKQIPVTFRLDNVR